MTEGSETDPKARITELTRRRNEIDAEIGRIRDGDIPLLNDTALKDRFRTVSSNSCSWQGMGGKYGPS
jgi:hypothetical protein